MVGHCLVCWGGVWDANGVLFPSDLLQHMKLFGLDRSDDDFLDVFSEWSVLLNGFLPINRGEMASKQTCHMTHSSQT